MSKDPENIDKNIDQNIDPNKKHRCPEPGCDFSCRKKHYFQNHMNKIHPKEFTKEQYKFIKPYLKKNFKDVKVIHGIPQVVFVFWFNHKNTLPPMSLNRFNALKSLIKNIGVPVIIITHENLGCFIKKNYPIHPGFQYLTGNHKSDYLRTYMLHHYGGGYHDIKFREKSWEHEWDRFEDKEIWIIGRRELKPDCIGHPPGENWVKKEYKKLVTMSWIICRRNTEYTRTLMKMLNDTLDKHLEQLIKHPAKIPRGYNPNDLANIDPEYPYPLRWLELMGEHFHPLMLKCTEHICFGLPDVVYKRYK